MKKRIADASNLTDCCHATNLTNMSTASRKAQPRTSSRKGPVKPRKIAKASEGVCNTGTCTTTALDFCRERALTPLLAKAIALAKKHFTPNDVSVYLSGDPDGDDQWLVVQSDVPGSVDTVLSAYRNLKTEWLGTVPSQEGSAIRFLYNIV
jgi:hypothetical protein